MIASLLSSRFICVFIALLLFASTAFARDYSIQIHKIESQARINPQLEIPALSRSQEVDLLETEIGCASMSLDAIMLAASIADACVTCPAYLANKTIMIFLKTVNRVSKAAGGYLSRGLLALFEKFRSGAISAAEFVARVQEFGFLKNLFGTGGEAVLRDSDRIVGELVDTCLRQITRSRSSIRAIPDVCDPAEAAAIFAQAGQKVTGTLQVTEQEFLDVMNDVSGIDGLRNVDPNNVLTGGGPLSRIVNPANSATAELKAEAVDGAFNEMKRAAQLKRVGMKEIKFDSRYPAGSRGEASVDVAWKNAEGQLFFDEVKSGLGRNTLTSQLAAQAGRLCYAARAAGAIAQVVISLVPNPITSENLDWIYNLEKKGIRVVDSQGNRITGYLTEAELLQKAQDCR